MRTAFAFLAVVAALWPFGALAQEWGAASGRILTAAEDTPVPDVSILVRDTNFGTASKEDGTYVLRLPSGTHVLRFSAVGYETTWRRVQIRSGERAVLDVRLRASTVEMQDIVVEGNVFFTNPGVYELDSEAVRNVPSPFKGFQALSVLPGVATNNELSNQYSVHGGGFHENLILINGFEVHMPLRPRQGEQEGLGLLNPDLADRIVLYTGGFPAKYGGKLSSVLDTRYRRPYVESMGGSVSASLLDASVAYRGAAADGRFGWNAGFRKARARHFFGTQELKGDYRPDYTDVQGLATWRFRAGHEIEVLGMYANHVFRFSPESRKTWFGVLSLHPDVPSDLRSFWTRYEGAEHDGYRTRFGGVRLLNRISPSVHAEHDIAWFGTSETERFDIEGTSVVFRVDPGGDPETGAGHAPIGNVSEEEFADNAIESAAWTGQGRYRWQAGRHAAEAGWRVRAWSFSDRIDEYANLFGRDTNGDAVRIEVNRLSDESSLSAWQTGAYVQNTMQRGGLTLTAGMRADRFSFNGAWTVSPRISARYAVSERLTATGSWGHYRQTPTYREFRGTPAPGETIPDALNRDIRSQRAVQYVVGGEYFLPARRLYVRAAAFYRDMDRLISYDVRNVRLLYSGRNDTEGRALGLDVHLYGELVPGLESRLNYGYLHAVETFLPEYRTEYRTGSIARPSDQRHTVSLFVQDYVPGDSTWKVHVRGLFGSGFPYTPPVPDRQVGRFVIQAPGARNSARYPAYRRVDLGATKIVDVGAGLRLELTAELLNAFNMTNTVAYAWTPNRDGIWERIPTRLTPRTFNLRIRLAW